MIDLYSLNNIAVMVDHLTENNHLLVRNNLVPLGMESTTTILGILLAIISNPKTKQTTKATTMTEKQKKKLTEEDELLLTATRTLNTLCNRSDALKRQIIELDVPKAIFRYSPPINSPDKRRNWLPVDYTPDIPASEILPPIDLISDRHIVYISRLIASLATIKDTEMKERLFGPDCFIFLRYSSRLRNKQMRLNMIKTLGELCGDGEFLPFNTKHLRQNG